MWRSDFFVSLVKTVVITSQQENTERYSCEEAIFVSLVKTVVNTSQ